MSDDVIEAMARGILLGDTLRPLGYFADGSPMRDAKWEDFLEQDKEEARNQARAALRAAEEAGWKLVPVEATPTMRQAAAEIARLRAANRAIVDAADDFETLFQYAATCLGSDAGADEMADETRARRALRKVRTALARAREAADERCT